MRKQALIYDFCLICEKTSLDLWLLFHPVRTQALIYDFCFILWEYKPWFMTCLICEKTSLDLWLLFHHVRTQALIYDFCLICEKTSLDLWLLFHPVRKQALIYDFCFILWEYKPWFMTFVSSFEKTSLDLWLLYNFYAHQILLLIENPIWLNKAQHTIKHYLRFYNARCVMKKMKITCHTRTARCYLLFCLSVSYLILFTWNLFSKDLLSLITISLHWLS